MSFSMLTGGLALFLEARFEFNVEQTGYVFAFSGLVGGLMQGGLGRLAKRLGEPRLALGGLIAMAVGYGCLALTFNLPVLVAVTFVSSAGSAVVRPALTTLLTKAAGRKEQGSVLGVSQSLSSSAQILAPMLAGFLIEHRKLGSYGLAAGAFAAVGAILLLVIREDPAAVIS